MLLLVIVVMIHGGGDQIIKAGRVGGDCDLTPIIIFVQSYFYHHLNKW